MSKPTPGPWIASPEVAWSGGTWNIDTEDGKGVATAWPGDLGPEAAEANAALIVEAVNAHDRLQAEHAKVEELLAVVQNGCNQLDDVELPAVALRFLFAVEEKAQAVKEARGE